MDDALPKFLCVNCLSNLEFAYTFKIQCEYTDRKFREAIAFGSVQNATIEKIEIDDGSLEEQQHDEYYAVDHLIEVDNGEDVDVEDIAEEIMYLDSTDTNTNDRTEDDDISPTNEEQSENEEMSEEKTNEMFWGFDDQSNASSQQQLQTTADTKDDYDETMTEDIDESAVSSTTTTATMAAKRRRLISKSKANSPHGKRPFQCDTCEETFDAYSKLNEHKKTHGKERYQCPTCFRWFQKRYHMKNHEKIHKGLKSYECDLCQKRYTSQTNLDRHIRVTHHNEKKHHCDLCGKSFSQLAILRQHHAVHMTERNFECDVCGKAFKLKQHLRLHQMRHLPQSERPKRKYKPPKKRYKPKLKPCVCTECGKHSNTMALHLSHMKWVPTNRPTNDLHNWYPQFSFIFSEHIQVNVRTSVNSAKRASHFNNRFGITFICIPAKNRINVIYAVCLSDKLAIWKVSPMNNKIRIEFHFHFDWNAFRSQISAQRRQTPLLFGLQ